MAKRFCYALDLKNDDALIAAYEEYHRAVWPEILELMRGVGILSMEIYRVENRLFMIMETSDDFDPEKKAAAEAAEPKAAQWEDLMWKYQKALPGSAPGEKWRAMDLIFDFKS
jgi:L-rhamnose mutarotase